MLETHRRRLVQTIPQALDAAGRLIAVSLATSTAPYGLGKNAQGSGEAATARDIFRVYATPARVAKSFSAAGQDAKGKLFLIALARRRIAEAQKLVDNYCPPFRGVPIRAFDNGTAHAGARRKGRVPAKQRPAMIVQTGRDILAYVKREVGHVGEAKGGWAACAKILGGTRGLPQWVTRHAGGLSGGNVAKNYAGDMKTVRMTNLVRYASDALSGAAKAEAIQMGINRFVRGQSQAILHGTARFE